MPFIDEIKGNINKIPTNSSLAMLFFSNILVSLLKRKISINQYKENHPLGNIGFNLKKIKDCLISDYPKLLIKESIPLHNVLLEMTKYKIGCSFFLNENEELLGVLTDGDIRKLLIKNENIKMISLENINKNFIYETDMEKYIDNCEKNQYIPILKNKKILGIFRINK